MSSFTYNEGYSILSAQTKVNKKNVVRKKTKALLILLIIIMSLILCGKLVYNYFILPSITLKTVQIISTNNMPVDAQKIKRLINLQEGCSYPSINCQKITQTLLNSMSLEDCVAQKKFPDRLVITITQREPLVIALYNNGVGKSLPVLFDKAGYIVSFGKDITNWDYPVISGDILFPPLIQGEQFFGKPLQVLESLSQIKTQNSPLYALISEIHFESIDGDNFDLLFFIRGHRIPLVMKENFDEPHLLKVIGVMDALKDVELDKKIALIDYRSQHITYTYKKGESIDGE